MRLKVHKRIARAKGSDSAMAAAFMSPGWVLLDKKSGLSRSTLCFVRRRRQRRRSVGPHWHPGRVHRRVHVAAASSTTSGSFSNRIEPCVLFDPLVVPLVSPLGLCVPSVSVSNDSVGACDRPSRRKPRRGGVGPRRFSVVFGDRMSATACVLPVVSSGKGGHQHKEHMLQNRFRCLELRSSIDRNQAHPTHSGVRLVARGCPP